MGYYLSYNDYINKKYIYIGGVVGVIGHLLTLYHFNINSSDSLFVILESIFIFYIFRNGHIKSNKIIEIVSNNSFCIYLVHPIYLNILTKVLKIYPNIMPFFVGEILFVVVVLSLSLLTSIVLHKIPFIKKIV